MAGWSIPISSRNCGDQGRTARSSSSSRTRPSASCTLAPFLWRRSAKESSSTADPAKRAASVGLARLRQCSKGAYLQRRKTCWSDRYSSSTAVTTAHPSVSGCFDRRDGYSSWLDRGDAKRRDFASRASLNPWTAERWRTDGRVAEPGSLRPPVDRLAQGALLASARLHGGSIARRASCGGALAGRVTLQSPESAAETPETDAMEVLGKPLVRKEDAALLTGPRPLCRRRRRAQAHAAGARHPLAPRARHDRQDRRRAPRSRFPASSPSSPARTSGRSPIRSSSR